MKKIISMILVLLMLSFALIACQKNEEGPGGPDGEVLAPEGDIDTSDVDVNGYQNDRIPEGAELEKLGFAGSEVKILSWEEEEAQTFPKENSTTDPIKSKLYNHYIAIEERLDITFKPNWCSSHTSKQSEF